MNGVLTRDYTREKLMNLLKTELFEESNDIPILRKKLFSSHSERRKK